jgi:hypothetical protein
MKKISEGMFTKEDSTGRHRGANKKKIGKKLYQNKKFHDGPVVWPLVRSSPERVILITFYDYENFALLSVVSYYSLERR